MTAIGSDDTFLASGAHMECRLGNICSILTGASEGEAQESITNKPNVIFGSNVLLLFTLARINLVSSIISKPKDEISDSQNGPSSELWTVIKRAKFTSPDSLSIVELKSGIRIIPKTYTMFKNIQRNFKNFILVG